MSILNFKKTTTTDYSLLVNQLREYKTKIKQYKLKEEAALEKLAEGLDETGRLYDEDGELLGTRIPSTDTRFREALLKADDKSLWEKYRTSKPTVGTWRWL